MLDKLKAFLKTHKKIAYHFIHIPKNGGNSIRKVLKSRGDVELSKPFHYRYMDVTGECGDDLKYFGIVRNPWARTASRYMFGKQNATRWSKHDSRRNYILNVTFEDFVRDQKIFDIPHYPGQPWMGPLSSWFNQLEWLRDDQGRVQCDCLRLEHINQDLSAYFDSQIVVPHKNETKLAYDYRELYTDDLIDKVAETFSEDIKYFGFTFDGVAIRNIYGL